MLRETIKGKLSIGRVFLTLTFLIMVIYWSKVIYTGAQSPMPESLLTVFTLLIGYGVVKKLPTLKDKEKVKKTYKEWMEKDKEVK